MSGLSGLLTFRFPGNPTRVKAFFDVGQSTFATEEYVRQKIAEALIGGDVDLSEYLKKTEAEDLYQPKGNYLTKHQSLAAYALKTEIPSLNGYATESWVESKNYLTTHQSLDDCVKKEQSLTLKGIKEDGTEVEFTIYGDQL